MPSHQFFREVTRLPRVFLTALISGMMVAIWSTGDEDHFRRQVIAVVVEYFMMINMFPLGTAVRAVARVRFLGHYASNCRSFSFATAFCQGCCCSVLFCLMNDRQETRIVLGVKLLHYFFVIIFICSCSSSLISSPLASKWTLNGPIWRTLFAI